jgi:HrpA-like RNA helicase
MSHSNTNEDADSVLESRSDVRHSEVKPSPLKHSRYYGNITIEMIDDFLNPISKNKGKDQRYQIKFTPELATHGMGLIEENANNSSNSSASGNRNPAGRNIALSRNDNDDLTYMPFSQRESARTYNYASYNEKKCYEQQLRSEAANNRVKNEEKHHHTNASAIGIGEDTRSIVGSGMSQLESVSVLSMSTSRRANLMRKAEVLAQTGGDRMSTIDGAGDSIMAGDILNDDNNNEVEMNKIQQMMDSASIAPILNEQEKRERALQLLMSNYKIRDDYDKKLPINSQREYIIKMTEAHQFCIIEGGTGCGKTTQVPQMILDYYVQERKYCNIIVTQPRRIAAMSVSRRVCSERNWELGTYCGYQIGLDRHHVSEDTRITYVTTGILLQKLIASTSPLSQNIEYENGFSKYTHIILDEVHERDLETDLVLLVLKIKSIQDTLPQRVIMMSATMECKLFRNYFPSSSLSTGFIRAPLASRSDSTPRIEIKQTTFKVQEFYWEDLLQQNTSFLSAKLCEQECKRVQEKASKCRHFGTSNFQQHLTRSSYVRAISSSQTTLQSNETTDSPYVNQLKQHLMSLEFNMDEPDMYEETIIMTINLLRYFDECEVAKVKAAMNAPNTSNESGKEPKNTFRIIDGFAEVRGSVLIFVPGMFHIQRLQQIIYKELNDCKLKVIPLHSDIVVDQQIRVFEKSEPTWRKIIISTSIAESSITVPDIKYVIDFGLTKELYSDPQTNYTHLRLEWASKSSMNQRRGRAGRVSDGTCYRLLPKRFYDLLPEHTKPAIQREPLSKVVLDVKRLKQTGEPKRILSLAIQPPAIQDIERTVLLLKEVGALTLKCKKSTGEEAYNDRYNGDLTYVGNVMANLPIDVRLAKLILLGHAFGKLRETIIIAAGLSTKTIFTCYYKSYLEAFKSKWIWADSWMCDCICILNAYNLWESLREKKYFENKHEERNWAKNNMIEIDRLREMHELRMELEKRLRNLNIHCNERIRLNPMGSAYDKSSTANKLDEYIYNIDNQEDVVNQNLILKILIAGAFYPNYFNALRPDPTETTRMVSGKDPCNTVQIKNLPNNEGVLYHKALIDMFSVCSKLVQVHFEDTKACIEFKSKFEQVSSTVNLGVYLAVEMRLLRLPMRIRKLKPILAAERLKLIEKIRIESSKLNLEIDQDDEGLLHFRKKEKSSKGSNTALNSKRLRPSSRRQSEHSDESASDGASTIVNDTDSEAEQNADHEDQKDVIYENFINPKYPSEKPPDVNQYLSNASIKSYYSSMISLNEANSLSGSRSNLSSSKKEFSVSNLKLNALHTSNRLTPCKNLITECLGNPRYLLPIEVDQGKEIDICIVDIIECGHFWAQIQDQEHLKILENIQAKLSDMLSTKNNQNLSNRKSNLSMSSLSLNSNMSNSDYLKQLNPNEICPENLCITHYRDPEHGEMGMYRARILHVDKKEQKAEVRFVDYGNKETRNFKDLLEISEELQHYSFQAIECKLANIKLSLIKNPIGTWTKQATRKFKDIINNPANKFTRMKVIDLDENNIARVELLCGSDNKKLHDVGTLLIKSEYAEQVDYDLTKLKFRNNYSSNNLLFIPLRTSGQTNSDARQVRSINNTDRLYNRKKSSKINPTRSEDDVSASETSDQQSEHDNEETSDSSSIADSENTESNINITDNEEDFNGYIELRGPYSPLEVTYFSILNVGHGKKARVERESINHASIDDDPLNTNTRLLISAELSLNATGDTIIMRKTTLLPKISGLSNLCCLLFAPTIEIRVNEKQNRYIGAVCGLGYDNLTKAPLYTDNDIECTFDVQIDMKDIAMVKILESKNLFLKYISLYFNLLYKKR